MSFFIYFHLKYKLHVFRFNEWCGNGLIQVVRILFYSKNVFGPFPFTYKNVILLKKVCVTSRYKWNIVILTYSGKRMAHLRFPTVGKLYLSYSLSQCIFIYLSPFLPLHSLSLSLSFSLFLSLFLQYTYFSSIPDISWQYRREIDHCRYNCVIYGEKRRPSHGKDNLIRKFKNHFKIRKYFVYNSLNIVYQKISKHTLLYFT